MNCSATLSGHPLKYIFYNFWYNQVTLWMIANIWWCYQGFIQAFLLMSFLEEDWVLYRRKWLWSNYDCSWGSGRCCEPPNGQGFWQWRDSGWGTISQKMTNTPHQKLVPAPSEFPYKFSFPSPWKALALRHPLHPLLPDMGGLR